ncbi:MAG: hypothetical protein FWH29_01215 [Methanobrevibacter sp.]|nr:hypothetical protein [Methanobrevibacter sp.]
MQKSIPYNNKSVEWIFSNDNSTVNITISSGNQVDTRYYVANKTGVYCDMIQINNRNGLFLIYSNGYGFLYYHNGETIEIFTNSYNFENIFSQFVLPE